MKNAQKSGELVHLWPTRPQKYPDNNLASASARGRVIQPKFHTVQLRRQRAERMERPLSRRSVKLVIASTKHVKGFANQSERV
jgi:hypothetical protein